MSRWNVEAETGYKPMTTFWDDFSIADRFGKAAIRDTFDKAFNGWKNNYKYLTELVMVLNWKIWEYYDSNDVYAHLYNELWMQTACYAEENLNGDELVYYFQTTD